MVCLACNFMRFILEHFIELKSYWLYVKLRSCWEEQRKYPCCTSCKENLKVCPIFVNRVFFVWRSPWNLFVSRRAMYPEACGFLRSFLRFPDVPRSCQEVKRHRSGFYLISPRPVVHPPFSVYCNFTDNNRGEKMFR